MPQNEKKELAASSLIASNSSIQEWITGSAFLIFSVGIGVLGIGVDAIDYGSKYGYCKGYQFSGPDYRGLLAVLIFINVAFFLFRLWIQKNNKNTPITLTWDMALVSFICLTAQVVLILKMNIVFP